MGNFVLEAPTVPREQMPYASRRASHGSSDSSVSFISSWIRFCRRAGSRWSPCSSQTISRETVSGTDATIASNSFLNTPHAITL